MKKSADKSFAQILIALIILISTATIAEAHSAKITDDEGNTTLVDNLKAIWIAPGDWRQGILPAKSPEKETEYLEVIITIREGKIKVEKSLKFPFDQIISIKFDKSQQWKQVFTIKLSDGMTVKYVRKYDNDYDGEFFEIDKNNNTTLAVSDPDARLNAGKYQDVGFELIGFKGSAKMKSGISGEYFIRGMDIVSIVFTK
jgi:hypothetical protein